MMFTLIVSLNIEWQLKRSLVLAFNAFKKMAKSSFQIFVPRNSLKTWLIRCKISAKGYLNSMIFILKLKRYVVHVKDVLLLIMAFWCPKSALKNLLILWSGRSDSLKKQFLFSVQPIVKQLKKYIKLRFSTSNISRKRVRLFKF